MGAVNDLIRERWAPASSLVDDTPAAVADVDPAAQGWTCWLRAESARLAGNHADSLRWLQAASRLALAENPSALLEAELCTTLGKLMCERHEPELALWQLQDACRHWRDIDAVICGRHGNPRMHELMEAVHVMLQVLTRVDRSSKSAAASLFRDWIWDRLISERIASARLLINVAPSVGDRDGAYAIAGELLAWLPNAIGSPAGEAVEVAAVHAELAYLEHTLRALDASVREYDLALQTLRPFAEEPGVEGRIVAYEISRAASLLGDATADQAERDECLRMLGRLIHRLRSIGATELERTAVTVRVASHLPGN
jgi:hypothetical protein